MGIMATPFKHPKSGIYYVRVVVPKNLREVIRKHEFKWSLRTKDLKTAKLRALPLTEKAYSQIESARRKLSGEADVELSFKDCVIVAERWYARMRDEVETQGNMLDSVSHDAFLLKIESIRVCRRLIILRELANERESNVFTRSPRASSSYGFDLRA